MASLATSVRWGTASPAIYFDVSYTATRSGANMVYTVNVDFQALSSSYGRYFGYPIYLDLSLDGVTKVSKATVKNPSPSNWSAGQVYYHSTSFSIAKTSGTTTLGLKIYSGEGSTRSQSYSYSLPVSPAASEMTLPAFTVGSAGTITMTRYNAGFTDTITYAVGNATGTVVSGSTASSVSWTPPTSLFLQMIGKSSVTGTMTCKTYSSGTLVGTTTKTFTLNADTVYNPPSVTINYARGTGTSSTFVETDDGPNVRIRANIVVNGGLTATYVLKLDGVEQVNVSGISSGTRVKYIEDVSSQVTHTVVATITDTLGSTASYSLTVSTQSVPLNINVDLPAVAFGKIAETAKTVELASDWKLKMGSDAQLTTTRTNNSYVNSTGWSNFACYRRGNFYIIRGYIQLTTAMATGIDWTEIGRISDYSALYTEWLSVATGNGTGAIRVQITTDGIVKIANVSGISVSGYCTFSSAVPIA